jgi:hypothetical protein
MLCKVMAENAIIFCAYMQCILRNFDDNTSNKLDMILNSLIK